MPSISRRDILFLVGRTMFSAWPYLAFFFPTFSLAGAGHVNGSNVWPYALAGLVIGLAVTCAYSTTKHAFYPNRSLVTAASLLFLAGNILIFACEQTSLGNAVAVAGSLMAGIGSSAVTVGWDVTLASLPGDKIEFYTALPCCLGVSLAAPAGSLPQPYSAIILLVTIAASCACLLPFAGRHPHDAAFPDSAPSSTDAEVSRRNTIGPALLPGAMVFGFCLVFGLFNETGLPPKMSEWEGMPLAMACGSVVMVCLVVLYYRHAAKVRFSTLMLGSSVLLAVGMFLSAISVTDLVGAIAGISAPLVEITAASVLTARISRREKNESAVPLFSWIKLCHYLGAAVPAVALVLLGISFIDRTLLLFGLTVLLFTLMASLTTRVREAEDADGAKCLHSARGPATPDGVEAWERVLSDITKGYGLTAREREVASLFARGRDVVFIRDELGVSRHTVETHVKHIYQKTGVHSKQELISMFEAALDALGRLS